jgi:hypothetical protein
MHQTHGDAIDAQQRMKGMFNPNHYLFLDSYNLTQYDNVQPNLD